MPVVPTLTARAELSAAPDLRQRRSASPDDFGAGIAKGVGQIADATAKVYVTEEQKARQQAQQIREQGSRNEYDNYMTPRLAQWRQRGGIDAQKNIGEFRDEHAKIVSDLTANLDPETRQRFTAYAEKAYVDTNRQLTMHAAEQAKVYDGQQFKARLDLGRTKVAQGYQDQEVWFKTTTDMQDEAKAFAERNNMSPEATQQMLAEIKSGSVRTRIEAYLDAENDITAKQLFDIHKDEFTAADLKVLREAVDIGSTKGEAARIGDEVFQKVREGQMTPTQAMDELKSMAGDNVKVREAATNHYARLRAMQEDARKAETSDAWNEAMRALADNDGMITAVPSSTLTRLRQLDPASIETLNKHAANWDPGRQTDRMAWLNLRQAAVDGSLAKMDVVGFYGQYHDQFSKADWDNAVALYGNSREAALKPEKASEWTSIQDGVRSELEMFKQILTERGVDYKLVMKGGNSPEQKEAMRVITAVDQAVADRKRELSIQQKRKVEKLPPDEMHRVVSSTLQAIAEPGKDPWGPGDYRKLPQFRKVPDDIRDKIIADWKRVRGDTPSAADVAEAYYKALRAGRLPAQSNP